MMGDGAGDLDCEPGVEFTEYVREHLSGFPPCSPMMCGSSKSRPTLWPGRRVEFTVKGKAQTAKVVKWDEWVTGFLCPYTMWDLTLEKEDGSQVEVSVKRVDIGEGGQVWLKDGATKGISDKLTWLDPPTTPDRDDSDEDEEEEEEEKQP